MAARDKQSVDITTRDAGNIKLAKYLMRNCNDLINRSQRHIKHNLLATHRVLVDGCVETNASRRIKPGQSVQVLGPTIFVYNKPCGVLTALSDTSIPCIGSTSPVSEYLIQYPGLHNVGRLDQHSCGLLLLTNDGHITRMLTDPKRGIARRYVCIVVGSVVDAEILRQRLVDGVETRYGTYHGNLIRARLLADIDSGCRDYEHKSCADAGEVCLRNDGPRQSEDSTQYLEYLDGMAMTNNSVILSEVVLEITEGKKREVRRMLAHCGHPVLNLRREAYGVFELDTCLKAGDIRAATEEEMDWVMQQALTNLDEK